MSEHNTLSDDFTQGSIVGKLVKFMVPVLGALILQAMYGAVDLLVVGQFGTDAGISAVATGSNIINLVTFVITALVMGVTVLISRYLGEKRNERIGGVIGGTVCYIYEGCRENAGEPGTLGRREVCQSIIHYRTILLREVSWGSLSNLWYRCWER